jgi:hypothetical protein
MLTYAIRVVPLESAIVPGYVPIGIHSNHMDMTKFERGDDPGFTAVAGELRRWVKELSAPSNGGVLGMAAMQQQPRVEQWQQTEQQQEIVQQQQVEQKQGAQCMTNKP